MYWFWWREQAVPGAQRRVGFAFSLKAGIATALGSARYRHILINVCTVFFATIAFAALLPVFVKNVLHLNASVFGLLMGSLGVGAVCGALLLPTIRQHVGKTRLLAASLLVYGAMLLSLSLLRSLTVLVPVIIAAGMAWSATVSTLNAAAQLSFPAAIRARTLSIYLFVMAGGYTAGSLVWGRVADHFGVQTALAAAGVCVVVNGIVLVTGKRETSI